MDGTSPDMTGGEERAATHEAGMPGRNRAALVITSVQGMASTIVYVGMDGRVGRAISRLGDAARRTASDSYFSCRPGHARARDLPRGSRAARAFATAANDVRCDAKNGCSAL